MARVPNRMSRRVCIAWAVVAAAVLGLGFPRAASAIGHPRAPLAATSQAAPSPDITTRPALLPAFDPSIPNYVTRCEPGERVRVSVSRNPGTPVTVDQQSARRGNFRVKLSVVAGQRFTVRIGSGTSARTYSIRCLPVDFPRFSVQRAGQTQAAYYLLTPTLGTPTLGPPYVVLFDNNGVPIWWYQELNGVPTNASLLASGNLAWDIDTGSLYGYPLTDHIEIHRLDGSLVRNLSAPTPAPIDSYEMLQLANGDFLLTGYALHQNVDLTALGEGLGPVFDATFEEVRSDGTLAYGWDSNGELGPLESARWWFAWTAYPHLTKAVWDWQHADSAAADGDGYLVSMCHADALYLVQRGTGSIEWKLGGTQTPRSLTMLGVSSAWDVFGCPSDARVLPDGTVSVFDNGALYNRPPRVLRFYIDPLARTARLVQVLTGPQYSISSCCGSARMLPLGNWVVDWGTTGVVDEVSPAGALLLRITFDSPSYSYRAVPILTGALSPRGVTAAMDKMYPRPHPARRRARTSRL